MTRIPVHFELTLDAPLDFVYSWLTDYEPTDSKLNPAMSTRRILERTGAVVKMEDEAVGTPLNRRTVTVHLFPPDAWDAGAQGTLYDYDLHYRLTPDGARSRLNIAGIVDTKPEAPFKTREENHARFLKSWSSYKKALEDDYRASKR